jgi:4-hydroxy-2-oxoheptanedioate aldolase
MRENRLRRIWAEGGSVLNGWLAIPNPLSAEAMAKQGWGSLTVDMQHGLVDYTGMVPMLTAISTTDTVPIVRVPWLEPGIIMKSLDAGAFGIICPMVNSRDDAEKFVHYTTYAPKGTRSFGPTRALIYAGTDYVEHADAEIVRFAMIETAEAMDNLAEITSTPGLDATYIGPSDLSIALGCKPSFDDMEPRAEAAVQRILEASLENNLFPAIHCGSVKGARRRIEQGFRLVTVSSDLRLMTAGAKEIVAGMAGAKPGEVSGY